MSFITNFHVIGNFLIDSSIKFSLQIEKYSFPEKGVAKKTIKARLKKVSVLYDLALLETVDFNSEHYLKIGELPADLTDLFTAGFPGEYFSTIELTNPRLLGRYRIGTDSKKNYSGEVSKGSSGSPIVNGKGEVVGVHFAGKEKTREGGLHTNLNSLKEFIKGNALTCGILNNIDCYYSDISFFCRHFKDKIDDDHIDWTYKKYCDSTGEVKKPSPVCKAAFDQLDREGKKIEDYDSKIKDYSRDMNEAEADYNRALAKVVAGDAEFRRPMVEAREDYNRALDDYNRTVKAYNRALDKFNKEIRLVEFSMWLYLLNRLLFG